MIFLTLIRALLLHFRRWLPAVLLLCCGAARADALFDGSAVSGCSYDSGTSTYGCTFLPSGYITINSGYTVNIAGSASMGSAKIDGTLNIGGSLDIAHHAYIDGSVNVAGAVSVGNHADITGDLFVAGDIAMDTQSQVEGNLSGHKVELYNAFTRIGGNASVYSIIIGNKGEVDGTITCTGPGAAGCSCVTDNSGHGGWAPSCGAAPPPVATFDHILVTHPGTALTCQPQTVTITACANAACTAPHYSGRVAVTLQPGNQQFAITGGSNNAATIQQTTAGTTTISAASTAPNPSTCLRTSDNSSSCQVTFSQVGLDMSIPDHKSENQQNITLQVLKQGSNTTSCVAVLANTTQNVNFACGYVNPASASPAGAATVRINDTPLGAGPTSACGNANVNVAFDATGVATPTLIYADAGKMSLTASMTVNGVALSQTKQFIVAPAAFKFFATQGTSKTNPEAPDDTGAAFIPAGQVFSTKLAAVNAKGDVTYNFGRESPAETYANITQTLVGPAGGLNPPLYAPSGAAFGGFQAPVNGYDTQSMYFNEVGIIALGATLANPQGYLGAGASSFRTTGSTNIGRFYPDHFNTAITSLQMNCNAVTSATSPCPAANTSAGKFLYGSQPFDMTVTAYNANNTVTANYTGLYAKPVSIEVWKADPTPNVKQNPGSASGSNALTWKTTSGAPAASTGFAATAFTAGVADSAITTLVDRHPRYDFAAIYSNAGPNTNLAPPTSVYLRAKESSGDGVTSLRLPVPSPSGEALVSFVSGRLLVNNTYGSPNGYSPVKVNAQFWTGGSFANNPAYVSAASTSLASTGANANVGFSNCQLKAGGSCSAPALQAGAVLNFSGGAASFNLAPLSAPGAVDVTLVWPDPVPVQSVLLPNLVYLPSTTGRATFGVYRAGPVVYLREVF